MRDLRVKTQGIRGGKMKMNQQGYAEIVFSNDRDFIAFDNFVGFGKDYKQREDVLINISSGVHGIVFTGTFDELIETFKEAKATKQFFQQAQK